MRFEDAIEPTPEEMDTFKGWITTNFGYDAAVSPFTFNYGGGAWVDLQKTWKVDRVSKKLDEVRTQHTLIYTDEKTGLEVRCVTTEYVDYPAVEWAVFFENNGDRETPVLQAIQSANVTFSAGVPGRFTLHHADGSHAALTDFQPHQTELVPGVTKRFAPYGGRSSDGVLPFFNLELPKGRGVISAVGWTGQWAASFTQIDDAHLNFQAGMERTHLKLYPGERIRVPAILLLFYNGDWLCGQNMLRRFLISHCSPMPSGVTVDPPVAASPHGMIGFESTTEANMCETIAQIVSNKLPVDTFWIDAGWYTCPDASTGGRNWAKGVGNWEADPQRYPNGMHPVANAAHNSGLKFLLWFEPERVMPGTWLYENHPDWILAPDQFPPEQQYQARDSFHLLNIGHPQALAWLKNKTSEMIGEIGIDIYRHDFNIHPLHYWREGEASDRQGVNEIRYITGLYDFFDTLLADHPNLVIDNCASGGRRIDFEMLRRSLALWRSDLCWEPVAEQCMTYGLSLWLPLHGVGSISLQPYDFRSGMGSNFSLALNYRDASIWESATKLLNEYKRIRHLFAGDFHPLTPYRVSDDVWLAWQFNRSDLGEGLIQAFRRSGSGISTHQFRLHGLDPKALYEWKDIDSGRRAKMTGDALMKRGLEVQVKDQPGAVVIVYRHTKSEANLRNSHTED